MEYIERAREEGCILCQKPGENCDEANYILYRGKNNFVILNAFPYNPGHLMVAPYRHTANLQDLTEDEAKEHFDVVRKAIMLLTRALKPAGFNVGLNIGRVAGAGIEDHIHTHIVPRWQGDANFMPVTANTKVISEALSTTYRKLKGAIEQISTPP
jgi:ATP adenylyltransferase